MTSLREKAAELVGMSKDNPVLCARAADTLVHIAQRLEAEGLMSQTYPVLLEHAELLYKKAGNISSMLSALDRMARNTSSDAVNFNLEGRSMGIRIVTAGESLGRDKLIVMVMGPPGVGKTCFAETARKPLMLDFDLGAHRASNRGDVVPVAAWGDVADITAEDVAPYDTIIIDTLGRALENLSVVVARRDRVNRQSDGTLTQRGYGALKTAFNGWFQGLRAFGKDIVVVAHINESKDGDRVVERVDGVGATKTLMYQCADMIGRLGVDGSDRQIVWSPTETNYGKDPGNLVSGLVRNPLLDPDALARDIEKTKKAIQREAEDSDAVNKAIQDWRKGIAKAKTADKMTELAKSLSEDDETDNLVRLKKRILMDSATGAGYVWRDGMFHGEQEAVE